MENTQEFRDVDVYEKIMSQVQKRRICDSSGRWHDITQTRYIFTLFDELIGLSVVNTNSLTHDPAKARAQNIDAQIMAAALAERASSKFPLDLCFQNQVLARERAALMAEVDAKLALKPPEAS